MCQGNGNDAYSMLGIIFLCVVPSFLVASWLQGQCIFRFFSCFNFDFPGSFLVLFQSLCISRCNVRSPITPELMCFNLQIMQIVVNRCSFDASVICSFKQGYKLFFFNVHMCISFVSTWFLTV